MATYDWSVFDACSAVSTQLLVPQAVALSQVFAAIPAPTEDDYSIAVVISGLALDAGAGPFSTVTDVDIGGDRIEIATGVATFAAGEVVVLRNSAGDEFITEVLAFTVGATDVVQFTEKTKISMATGSTIERSPRIEVALTEGIGSAGGGLPWTEVIWLADLAEYEGRVVSRIRIDRGTTFTVSTFDFTATTIQISDFIDGTNLYRSDRRTPRALMAAALAPQAAIVPFTQPFLSHGSGHKASARIFGATIDRYAEQHPPIRLEVGVTAGADFTGGVTIEGFRTIWSPIRGAAMAPGAGSVRISPECYSQFQIGDVVTLFNLNTNLFEAQTILTKTAPDLLNFVGVTANAYALDDIVGIVQSETVSVAAGIGTYYTADAWVYPLWHNTAGGTEDFTYQVFQSVQGFVGCLHSADNRLGAGIAGALLECNPVIQSAVGSVQAGDGIVPTAFGQLAGAYISPRHTDGQVATATSDTLLWWGVKSKTGLGVSPMFVMRGSLAAGNDFFQVAGDATNGVVCVGMMGGNRKVLLGGDAGRNDCLDPAFWRMAHVIAYTRNWYRQSTTNVRAFQLFAAQDTAGDTVVGGVGASLQINAPTNLGDFAIVQDAQAFTRAIAIATSVPLTPAQPIRIEDFNAAARNAAGGASSRFTMLSTNRSYTGRAINSYFTQFEMRSNTGVGNKQSIQSAVTAEIQVIDENGDPVEGALVKIVDITGALVVDEVTDVFGRIPLQELVSMQFDKENAGGTDIWQLGDALPANVTRVDFSPFELMVLPQVGVQEGYVPSHTVKNVAPFDPTSKIVTTVVLHAPRPDGQFGDAGFGEF